MELNDRQAKETSFAVNLAGSFANYRHKLAPHLSRGEPIPDAEWSEIEDDMRKRLTAILLLLYVASATQHGLGASAAETAGTAFATARANEIASRFVANSRSRIGAQLAASTGTSGTSATATLSPSRVEDILASTLGPDRAATIAATETTVAASAGGEGAIGETIGTSEFDLWFTENDGRVCKTCGPLHAKRRSAWQQRFPAGPPGHPGCRCWISYEHERN